MKQIHSLSMILGLAIGLLLGIITPYFQSSFAQDNKKEIMTQEEVDKKLDEVIESQKELLSHIETITTQTQFVKATAGK